jgi:hypothetical protein
MEEQQAVLTFYDVIKIDASQYMCKNGHTVITAEEEDRIGKEVRRKEWRIKASAACRVLLVGFAGAIIFLLGGWAALILIPSPHVAIALLIGGSLTLLFLMFCWAVFFKTFNAYYWAKEKAKGKEA